MKGIVFLLIIFCFHWVFGQDQPDYDIIPGLDQIGRGYDAIKGKSTYQQIVQFDWTEKNFWINPFNSSLIYSVPDQANVMEYYTFESSSQLYRSTQEYSSELMRKYALEFDGISTPGSSFSLNPDLKYVETVVSDQKNIYSQTQQYTTINKIDLSPYHFLGNTPDFLHYIETLPLDYDAQAYRRFINDYGTHVIHSGILGGRATMESSLKSEYSSKASDTVISSNAKVNFGLAKLSIGIGGSFSKSSTTSQYSESTQGTTKFTLEGGNPFYRDITKWPEWVKTVKNSPSLLEFQLTSISNYIPDEIKAQHTERAIKEYMDEYNTNTPPVPPPPIKLGSCNCQMIDDIKCPFGYAISNISLDYNDYFLIPITCCKPCISWKATYAFENSLEEHNLKHKSPLEAQKIVNQHANYYTKINLAYENNKIPSKCGKYQCIPGIDRLGIGFDMVTGDKKNIDVIQFTYEENNVWTSPYSKLKYNYPDQCSMTDESKLRIETSLFRSLDEYAKNKATSAGVSVWIPGMFSLDTDICKSSKIFSRGESVMVLYEEIPELYVISLPPAKLLTGNVSSLFSKMVDLMPEQYNEEFLRTFVFYFGTHFISKSSYGGKSVMKTAVDQQLYSSEKSTSIKASASIRYNAFKTGGDIDNKDKETLKIFEESSFSELYLYGGNFEDFSISNWDHWLNTTQYSPVQVRYELEPLHYLIKNDAKRENLQRYITEYIKQHAKENPETMQASILESVRSVEHKNYFVDCRYLSDTAVVSGFEDESYGTPFGFANCTSFTWSVPPTKESSKISKCECEILSQEPYSGSCPAGKYITSYHESGGFFNSYPMAPIECCAFCYE